MKTIIISYSLTGNNDALATSLAKEFAAEHIRISESKTRTMFTIVIDLLFNRTPRVNLKVDKPQDYDLVIFMGPVWMGKLATPLRAYLKHLKGRLGQYAFVTISGGAEGGNPKLADELKKRVGKVPAALINFQITDLLPANPKPDRKTTMAYRLSQSDIKKLTDKAAKTLQENNKYNVLIDDQAALV